MTENEFRQISEIVAEAVHQAWMKGRTAEGWVYGPEKNPAAKTDPNIRPYEELPESEKDYDRNTARAVLQTMDTLGYRVVKDDQ